MSADPAHAGLRQGVRPGGSDTLLRVLATPGFADYALVDSGNGRKLERFGRFTVDRPEPQAMWQPALEPGVWLRADASFKSTSEEEEGEGGRWRKNKPVPPSVWAPTTTRKLSSMSWTCCCSSVARPAVEERGFFAFSMGAERYTCRAARVRRRVVGFS